MTHGSLLCAGCHQPACCVLPAAAHTHQPPPPGAPTTHTPTVRTAFREMQVLAVLAYAHENDVEPFLEPALRLCASLMNDVGGCLLLLPPLCVWWVCWGGEAGCAPRSTTVSGWMVGGAAAAGGGGGVCFFCMLRVQWCRVEKPLDKLPIPAPPRPHSGTAPCRAHPHCLCARRAPRLLRHAGPSESQKVIASLHVLLELAAGPDPDAALSAAHCLLKAAHLHPGDAAAVLATGDNVALLIELMGPRGAAGSGAAAAAAGGAGGGSGGGGGEQQEGWPQQQQPPPQLAAFQADLAPLLLLVLAAVVEARPGLLREHGAALRPAVTACLQAVGDAGLKRRWARLLAAQGG